MVGHFLTNAPGALNLLKQEDGITSPLLELEVGLLPLKGMP